MMVAVPATGHVRVGGDLPIVVGRAIHDGAHDRQAAREAVAALDKRVSHQLSWLCSIADILALGLLPRMCRAAAGAPG